jgi:hypothetical protein
VYIVALTKKELRSTTKKLVPQIAERFHNDGREGPPCAILRDYRGLFVVAKTTITQQILSRVASTATLGVVPAYPRGVGFHAHAFTSERFYYE